jgi:hypothetical protein
MIKGYYYIIVALGLFACSPKPKNMVSDKSGIYGGLFTYGNFSDEVFFEVEQDSAGWQVFFSSLEQNANRIPLQEVDVTDDSISFILQSDFYTYVFKNRWIDQNNKLEGSLFVDTVCVHYILGKDLSHQSRIPRSEEVHFRSNGIELPGTIWYPDIVNNSALVILTSSGNADRSASRAEAILFAQRGHTTFHYNKRGTGNTPGQWTNASMEELAADDINAIVFFSQKTGIPLSNIGIKGSSQGASKLPYILNELENVSYGIAVSCPGVSLLESDLNYWRNRNKKVLGKDIDDASALQRKVFEYIAGERSRTELEEAIEIAKNQPWFAHVWIPVLDEVQTDTKLLFSPIPYFEKTRQDLLILQGSLDEIIPGQSIGMISDALKKAGNSSYETILLDGASHSMYYVGTSDFPYWSKLHPDYIKTIKDWVDNRPKQR